jgi:biotin transport system substrate-specific component
MANARVIAERVIPGEGILWDAVRIAAANLLLVLCAHIAIPIPGNPVPFTLQTFGVLLIAVLLGSRRAAIAASLYLLEGAMGLPVFQPFGLPGAARLIGPTAGYLWAYPLAAFATGWLAECLDWTARAWSGVAKLAGAVLLGQAIILSGGWAWLAAIPHLQPNGALGTLGWGRAFVMGVAPFLLDALVKTGLVIAAARGIHRARPA